MFYAPHSRYGELFAFLAEHFVSMEWVVSFFPLTAKPLVQYRKLFCFIFLKIKTGKIDKNMNRQN